MSANNEPMRMENPSTDRTRRYCKPPPIDNSKLQLA
jgi:hypothetical protein